MPSDIWTTHRALRNKWAPAHVIEGADLADVWLRISAFCGRDILKRHQAAMRGEGRYPFRLRLDIRQDAHRPEHLALRDEIGDSDAMVYVYHDTERGLVLAALPSSPNGTRAAVTWLQR